MRFTPVGDEAAGMLLYKDERHQYFLKVCLQDGRTAAVLEKVGMDSVVLGSVPLPENTRTVDLSIASDDGLTFRFQCTVDGAGPFTVAEGVDASSLSTAMAGGFTGTTIGLYAVR